MDDAPNIEPGKGKLVYDKARRTIVAQRSSAAERQQIVARIKRSSKYYDQTTPGEWFDVRAVGDRSYPWRGNDNNYRTSDLAFGVRLDDGAIVEFR